MRKKKKKNPRGSWFSDPPSRVRVLLGSQSVPSMLLGAPCQFLAITATYKGTDNAGFSGRLKHDHGARDACPCQNCIDCFGWALGHSGPMMSLHHFKLATQVADDWCPRGWDHAINADRAMALVDSFACDPGPQATFLPMARRGTWPAVPDRKSVV